MQEVVMKTNRVFAVKHEARFEDLYEALLDRLLSIQSMASDSVSKNKEAESKDWYWFIVGNLADESQEILEALRKRRGMESEAKPMSPR
jgi:hypothetical protein